MTLCTESCFVPTTQNIYHSVDGLRNTLSNLLFALVMCWRPRLFSKTEDVYRRLWSQVFKFQKYGLSPELRSVCSPYANGALKIGGGWTE